MIQLPKKKFYSTHLRNNKIQVLEHIKPKNLTDQMFTLNVCIPISTFILSLQL